MRIAVVTPWFPNKRDGWPARFVSDSAISLARAGAIVSVSVIRGWVPFGLEKFAPLEYRGRIERIDFPEIERLRTRCFLAFSGNLVRPLINIFLDRIVEAELTREIAIFKPDIIHVQTEFLAPAAVKVAAKYKLPVVITIHGENTNAHYTQTPRQAARFRAALSRANRVVIVGEPLRSYSACLADRADHIEYVFNGVESPVIQCQVPVPDIRPLELICVANMQEGKGISLLIDALSRLKPKAGSEITEWRLTLIGGGPLRSELQSQTDALGLSQRVVFAGTMTNSEVFDCLQRADIFVLPSYREAFGIAYLEAMASGLLTIGVEGQGPSQFIEQGLTGLLVKPREVNSLVEVLRSVLTDQQRSWRTIARAGAAIARSDYSWDAHAERLLDTFRKAKVALAGAAGQNST